MSIHPALLKLSEKLIENPDRYIKEFVDLDNKLGNGWADMHEVMAILYRPVTKKKGDKYNIEDYDFKTANKRIL